MVVYFNFIFVLTVLSKNHYVCVTIYFLCTSLSLHNMYKIHTQAHRTHLCMQHERLGRIYRKRRHDLPHVACGITDYSVDIQRFFFILTVSANVLLKEMLV